jgi:hypothetical protein
VSGAASWGVARWGGVGSRRADAQVKEETLVEEEAHEEEDDEEE